MLQERSQSKDRKFDSHRRAFFSCFFLLVEQFLLLNLLVIFISETALLILYDSWLKRLKKFSNLVVVLVF